MGLDKSDAIIEKLVSLHILTIQSTIYGYATLPTNKYSNLAQTSSI